MFPNFAEVHFFYIAISQEAKKGEETKQKYERQESSPLHSYFEYLLKL